LYSNGCLSSQLDSDSQGDVTGDGNSHGGDSFDSHHGVENDQTKKSFEVGK